MKNQESVLSIKTKDDKVSDLLKVLQDCKTWIEGDDNPLMDSNLKFGESNALDLINEALYKYKAKGQ